MSFNTFGHLFRVTTFGESHGPAIGCVVDGAPAGIALTAADIQHQLDRRRPGQSRFTTQRQEPDAVKIMSGVFVDDASGAQVTTGGHTENQRALALIIKSNRSITQFQVLCLHNCSLSKSISRRHLSNTV